MTVTRFTRLSGWVVLTALLTALPARAADDSAALAKKAHDILKANCYRCHGQDGAIEGGLNYILDLSKLTARRKVVPGSADSSPLYRRVASGKMPPPDEKPRPSEADVAVLKQWIDAGAPSLSTVADRPRITDADVYAWILADLEKLDKRSRRFARYFTLTHLYNAGLGADELQTYRHALAKLVNSLSWHPRLRVPVAIDAAKTVLRIDLRDFQWDANLWNRVLAEYPYGVLHDTATAKAVAVTAATRMPFARADWFVATASRPPLYYDLLQTPTNVAELERQLRVDVAVNIQQERVARAGFNGSGVAKNNRLLERHDAVHGAYWKTYDFEAVPQNLVERENLLPDRRNLFAHPLGPGATENFFQHAGGEVIYNLPNGLQGYLLVNANGVRVDKAPTALVSDPKRPDRAVEAGISCMACHYRGILPKTDQVRDYVQKNPKAFSKSDAELILALYVPGDKMKALMDEDAERFRKAVEKLGARVSAFEPVSTMTLRYEDDLDLPTAAAELSLKPDELRDKLGRSETLSRNLGALKVAGGVVQRQVFIQSFGDLVKQLRLGTLLKPTLSGQSLPDNTGELDPLEGQSSQANSMAFSPDGRRALFASADKSVRLWDVERERDLRRFIGHTASVWSVAFAPDGRQALSGGADHTVRLWDVETGRELHAFKGHEGLVTAVAFSPDGRQALSGGYDHAVLLWDLEKRREIRRFSDLARYVNHVAFSPDGRQALICGGKDLLLLDLEKGRAIRRLTGHADAVILAAFSADGRRLLSGSDDGTARLWDVETGHQLQVYQGHAGSVKSVAFAPDGRQILSAGADTTVRLWEVESGKELRRFEGHVESVLHVAFLPDRRHGLSGGRDSAVRIWDLAAAVPPLPPREVPPSGDQGPAASAARELRPTKAIPVKGIVSSLVLAPDGKWLYYLDASARKVLRLDVAAQVAANSVQLDDETEVLVLSPDGKRLYTLGSIPGRPLLANTPLDPDVKDSQVQVIDAAKMEVRAPLRLSGPSFDLAARDGGTVFVSLGNGQWTEILGLDVVKRSAPTSWGGVWRNSFLKLSPDQKRLYVSTQGVMPGQIDAFVIPEKLDDKPVQYTSPEKGKHPLGGEFLLSPDGKFLLCKTGTVLRLSAEREEDLKYAATVELFLAAAVDPERRATLLLTQDGSLKHYSYPDFKVRGTYRLGGLAYQAAYDGKQARLYVAVVDPKLLAERPRARGFGDIHVYDLKAVLREAGQ